MITHSPFLDNPFIPHFQSSICLCTHVINIINVFHNINLALYMVTSIHNMETWKRMGVVRRFKGQKKGKSSMISYDEVDE